MEANHYELHWEDLWKPITTEETIFGRIPITATFIEREMVLNESGNVSCLIEDGTHREQYLES